MIELPDLKQLFHIVEWDTFIFDVLIPICLDHGWHIDFDSIEDLCCVIYGHFSQRNPQDWQRFISDFIVPFSQERGWTVEIWSKEGLAILIHAVKPVEPEPETDSQQLNFFNLVHSTQTRGVDYQDEKD